MFTLFGGAINWMSKQQVVVVFSNTKVEYMVATHAYKSTIWLKILCSNIKINKCSDSHNAIFLAKNPIFHVKTKHIDVQYYFVRDMFEDDRVKLVKVDFDEYCIFFKLIP